MAKTIPQKSKNGTSPSDNGAAPPESLDQVRDILFGGQMRMVDSRLSGLEERLLQGQAALRAELSRQIAEVDDAQKKGLAVQTERLTAERTKRAEDLKALGAELKEALKGLERRHLKLEEAAGIADAELRDQYLKQSAAFSAELARVGERLSTELERSATALQTEKLDIAALAGGLTDLAARLTGGGRSAGKGGSRG